MESTLNIKRLKIEPIHKYLFMLMMLDYTLTYIGINSIGIIEEGNPIMVWMLELPFTFSFLFRAAYSALMVLLVVIVYNAKYKYYKPFVIFCVGLNVTIMFLHFHWVGLYLHKIMTI